LFNRFDNSYRSFQKGLTFLDKFIASYLNVTFIKPKKTFEDLNILIKFRSVSQRNLLRPIINDKYVEIFSNYEKDLDDAEKVFEEFKANPPLNRNAPPTAGAITWSRQLQLKITDPMKLLKENRYITELATFSVINKKYNNLLQALTSYEHAHLNRWRNTIEETRLGLQAFLLIKDDKNYTFSVNTHEKLMLLFQDAKFLTRIGINIPKVAKDLIKQEKKFKSYKSNLDMLHSEYESVIQMIPQHLFGLFEVHVKQTLDLCNQGCTTLTWNSLNIDSFLKIFENGIKKLKHLIILVKETKEEPILSLINEIKDVYLFDDSLAFSANWNPDEFVSTIGGTIKTKQKYLIDKITNIEVYIEDIGHLLLLNIPVNTKTKKSLKRTKLDDLLKLSDDLTSLKNFYSHLLYDAINQSVLNSLNCLAQACGYKIEINFDNKVNPSDEDAQMNEIVTTEDVNVSSSLNSLNQKNNGLTYMRLKSSDNLLNRQERPTTVGTAIAKTNWEKDRRLEDAFLK
jgi:dynein heavy chain, axonemal